MSVALPKSNFTLADHDESKQGEAFEFNKSIKQTAALNKKFYIESYGCALNFNDSEIVATLLNEEGYGVTNNFMDADLILINTCSIRENAEQKVRDRLKHFKAAKKKRKNTLIGVLGCMAERIKQDLLEQEQMVDMVIGPDAYRELPSLIKEAESGHKAVNVLLSREETYADIAPTRLISNGVTGFVTIARGCNNMCSFCVVPFTRGRERSRSASSIINECTQLFNEGLRDITLLGQNVDSYLWTDEANNTQINFAQLLIMCAQINPLLRVRFSTSHPKDITDEVLHAINAYPNICKQIHLPIQSGNTRILNLMNRTYTREWYLDKFETIKRIIPDCAVSTDIITGFCSETDAEHQDTLDLIDLCKFDFAYHFKYSERSGTPAHKKLADDVPEDIKQKRLDEVIEKCRKYAAQKNKAAIGKVFEILIEGPSAKNPTAEFKGRNSQNQMVVFPSKNLSIGTYVNVLVTNATTGTLIGEIV